MKIFTAGFKMLLPVIVLMLTISWNLEDGGISTYISFFEKIFLVILANISNQINQVYLNCHQFG